MQARHDRPSKQGTARSARGATLLELLIVVGVILALLAIALPVTLSMLDERELSATEENIASELVKARVHAQESGKPVEVVVLDAPSRIAMHYFDVGAQRDDTMSQSSSSSSRALRGTETQKQSKRARDAWQEESQLGPSIHVASLDTSDPAGDALDAQWRERDASGDADIDANAPRASSPLRVAVFLPDGSILFAATLLLMHDNGLHSRVTLDPWTGQPAIARGTATGERDSKTVAECPPDEIPDSNASSAKDVGSAR